MSARAMRFEYTALRKPYALRRPRKRSRGCPTSFPPGRIGRLHQPESTLQSTKTPAPAPTTINLRTLDAAFNAKVTRQRRRRRRSHTLAARTGTTTPGPSTRGRRRYLRRQQTGSRHRHPSRQGGSDTVRFRPTTPTHLDRSFTCKFGRRLSPRQNRNCQTLRRRGRQTPSRSAAGLQRHSDGQGNTTKVVRPAYADNHDPTLR